MHITLREPDSGVTPELNNGTRILDCSIENLD